MSLVICKNIGFVNSLLIDFFKIIRENSSFKIFTFSENISSEYLDILNKYSDYHFIIQDALDKNSLIDKFLTVSNHQHFLFLENKEYIDKKIIIDLNNTKFTLHTSMQFL